MNSSSLRRKRPSTRRAAALLIGLILLITGRSEVPAEQLVLEDVLEHRITVNNFRQRKDNYFKNPATSPLAPEKIRGFKGLNYFPIDYTFRTEARYRKTTEPEYFNIQTTTGEKRLYVRVGRLSFTLQGDEFSLMVYQEEGASRSRQPDRFFVPFTDLTSTLDTYGAGRYLDIRLPESGPLIIDFNLAYNPYCAYNHNYSCPIPPRENRLDLKITAGEKK